MSLLAVAAACAVMTGAALQLLVLLMMMSRGLPAASVRDTLTASFVGFAPIAALALALTGTGGAVPGAAAVAAGLLGVVLSR